MVIFKILLSLTKASSFHSHVHKPNIHTSNQTKIYP